MSSDLNQLISPARHGLDSSITTIEKINKINAYKSSLLDGSDNAKNLGEALGMLEEGYNTAIENLTYFIQLSFTNPEEIKKAESFLLKSKFGYVSAKLRRSRASCDVIEKNYYNFLGNWFTEKLGEEAIEIDKIFKSALFHDDQFVFQMEQMGEFLIKASETLYNLSKGNKLGEAISKHAEMSKCIEDRLAIISKEYQKLSVLESEFRKS
jgi:hypothetical protein